MSNISQPSIIQRNVTNNNINVEVQKINVADISGAGGKDKRRSPVAPTEQAEHIHNKRRIYNKIITIREKEVLQLLSNGDSSKIIADKLHISETTAITHRKHLIQKLHVKNTAHLIKIAVLSKIIF